MLCLCHRGYHTLAPENTLDAFEAAVELGVDGLETDVQLSGDGIPVMFHDRLSPDGRLVEDLPRKELSRLVGYVVPTLAETLLLLGKSPRRFLWNFELKHPNVAAPAMAAITPYLHSANILISSFWHGLIGSLSAPDLRCAIILAHAPLPFDSRPSWIPAPNNVDTLVWCFDRATPEGLSQARQLGFRNFVYDAVTAADHAQLAEWGADGVITDYPAFR
ncbi:MAG: glycerophosphodiester phosphodiesterase [Nitrospira sp.]|nr:glycerophosphodiester phosphodiesterase [Nitrospira sp.]